MNTHLYAIVRCEEGSELRRLYEVWTSMGFSPRGHASYADVMDLSDDLDCGNVGGRYCYLDDYSNPSNAKSDDADDLFFDLLCDDPEEIDIDPSEYEFTGDFCEYLEWLKEHEHGFSAPKPIEVEIDEEDL